MNRVRAAVLIAAALAGVAARARAQPQPDPAAAPPTDAAAAQPSELELLDDGVARLAQSAREQGQAALAAKDYPAALKALQRAHELDKSHAGVAQRLAELYALLGNAARAEQIYREALALDPDNADSHVGLAEQLARDGGDAARLAEAAALLARARELRGNDPAIVLRQARVAAQSGRFAEAEQVYLAYQKQVPPSDELYLELGDFHRAQGNAEQALAHYRKVSPERAAARSAAQRIFELDVEREARELGLASKGEPISEQARALSERARLLSARGEPAAAESLLRNALALAPGFSRARSDLGDALRARGKTDAAEIEYLRALSTDPTQADTYARLAELYLAAPEPRPAEAALMLERALRVRPEQPGLQLALARAYQRAGDLPRALFHASRALVQAEPGPSQQAAQTLRDQLERVLGAAPDAATGDLAAGAARAAAAPIARARAHLARGETDAALAELRRLPEAERSAELLALEGRVLHAAGRLREAARVLEQAIAKDAGQADALEELGLVLASLGRGEEARARFEACAARGRAACDLELARLDAGTDHGALSFWYDAQRPLLLLAARERLARLAERGADLPLARADLQALRARVDERMIALIVVLVALVALLASAAAILRAGRYGGIDLGTLIDRHPEAGPEAMRILSAIRHEVLKHNTLALIGLCDALRRGEVDGEKARHLERALFGGADGGAHARLLGYFGQLEQLGRAHGERLNLAHRDAGLSPLLAGFAALAPLRPALRDLPVLNTGARARLLARLEHAAECLHERGALGVRSALDRIRFFRVDAARLRDLFERTRREPALAARVIAELTLETGSALPCTLGMPEHAFADVLTNLLRNALMASLAAEPDRMAQIGLRVRVEIDEPTGLECIAFLVCDHAAPALPRAALHRGYIEAGLGLTADLVARYEGSLDVVLDEPGWRKAVVLRLPGNVEVVR